MYHNAPAKHGDCINTECAVKRGKRGRWRPQLTFENTVSQILEAGQVKSIRTPGEVDDSGRGERHMQRP